MNKPTEFKNKDLRSGYVVEFRNGVRRIVTRVNDFTRVLVNPLGGEWNYLSEWDDDLKVKRNIKTAHYESKEVPCFPEEYDIVKVYGLVDKTCYYGLAFTASPTNRPLLWERKDPVKMTVAEICAKLGYEVEIVAEVQK